MSWPPSELALEAKPVSVKLFLQMAQYTASLFHGMAKDGDEGPFLLGQLDQGHEADHLKNEYAETKTLMVGAVRHHSPFPVTNSYKAYFSDNVWLPSNSCTHHLLINCGFRGQVLVTLAERTAFPQRVVRTYGLYWVCL